MLREKRESFRRFLSFKPTLVGFYSYGISPIFVYLSLDFKHFYPGAFEAPNLTRISGFVFGDACIVGSEADLDMISLSWLFMFRFLAFILLRFLFRLLTRDFCGLKRSTYSHSHHVSVSVRWLCRSLPHSYYHLDLGEICLFFGCSSPNPSRINLDSTNTGKWVQYASSEVSSYRI